MRPGRLKGVESSQLALVLDEIPVGVAVYRLNAEKSDTLDCIGTNRAATELGLDALVRESHFARVLGVARSREPDEIGKVSRVDADGERTHSLLRAIPLQGGHVAVLIEDTTAIEREKREHRELGSFLDTVIEHLPAMVFVKDAEDLRFVKLNKAAEDLLGISRDAMIGKSDYDFFPPTQAAFFQAADRETLSSERVTDITEEPIQTPSGQRWLHTRKIPIPGEEGPTHLLGVSFDITAKKRAQDKLRIAENNFRTLVELTPDPIFVTRGALLLYVNPALDAMLGPLGSKDRLNRHAAVAFVHPDDRDRITKLLEGASQNGTTERSMEFRLVTGTGDVRVLEGGVAPCEFDGHPAVVVAAHDVTERRMQHVELERRVSERTSELLRASAHLETERAEHEKAQHSLTKLEEQLRHSQRLESIGRLVGGIAHDFNNMLSVISSYANLLLADTNPEDASREDLLEIQAASDRAARLARQLLAFGRQQVLEPRAVDMNVAVMEMARMLRRVVGEEVELRVSCQAMPGNVFVDPTQLEQVLMNLVVNAKDSMTGRGCVTIETTALALSAESAAAHGAAPGKYVVLAVTDTGVGMDRDTQARVFEPFFTTKEPGKGSGLGLATVFGIVKQSGGQIFIYSEPGEGTTFKIYLPAHDGDAEAQAEPKRDAVRGSETILVVEDDEQVRALVRTVLRRNGYRVLEARTPAEAIGAVEESGDEIDALLTDIVMPQMSGHELVKLVRQRCPNIKPLLMSGYSENVVRDRGLLAPGVGFLSKPLTPEMLTKRLREVLGR
jgi:two-component system, cell cycle sensor histidine kinase and response regulator CckA